MKTSKLRLLTALMAVVLCLGSFSTVAYAQADPDEETTEPVEIQPGEPFFQGSDIVTRDLLYDKATNKQFITIEDREGNIFYLIIDYDAPVNEEEEQYTVYFLNPVDTADLAALAGEEQAEPIVCTCTDHCAPGAIDMSCLVCAADMTQCAGKETKPVETAPPDTQVDPEPEPEPEPETGGGTLNMALAAMLLVALAGGGAFAYMKFFKKKKPTKPSPDLDDYEFDDDDEDEDGSEAPDDDELDMEDDGYGAESEDE